jgi:hypothetical protein
MIQDENQPSGLPNETGGQNGGKKEDVVAHATYLKVLNEAKAAKAKLAEAEAERERERQAKLEQEGKFKEAADEWKKKFEETEKKAMSFVKTYGQKVFASETKSVALELGANPDALEDIIKTGDWSEVEIGNDFSVDREKLKAAVSKMQQAKPWFFKSQVSAPKDVTPGQKPPAAGTKSIEQMSVDELIEYTKKNFKK